MATGGKCEVTGGGFMATGGKCEVTGGGFMATGVKCEVTGGGFMATGGKFASIHPKTPNRMSIRSCEAKVISNNLGASRLQMIINNKAKEIKQR
jgi:hypothetical protein